LKISVRDLALKEVKQRWEANANNGGQVNLYLQPDLPEFVSKAITESAISAMRLYGKDYLPDATLFAGTKSDWYTKTYCEYRYSADMQSDCLAGKFGGPGSGSGWPQEFPAVDAYGAVFGPFSKNGSAEYSASPAYIFLSSYKDKTTLTGSVYSAPAHELFHTLQQFNYGGGATTAQSATNSLKKAGSDCSNFLSQCPSIWVEGSAFYFGYAAAEMTKPNILNSQGLPLSPSWIKENKLTMDQMMNLSVSDMMKSPETANSIYFAGGIMTELLVAEFGIEAVLGFTKNSAAGLTDPTYNFTKNFKTTFGIDWADWSPKADTYLQNTLNGKITFAKDLEISEEVPKKRQIYTPLPSPTPTAKPLPTATPTSFQNLVENASGITYAAWLKSKEKINNSKTNLGNSKILIGPNTVLNNKSPLDALNLTSALYASAKQVSNVYLIYFSQQDIAWAQSEFDKLNDNSVGGSGAALNNCRTEATCWGASTWLNKAREGIILIAVGVKDENHTSGSLEAHEYSHTIQMFQAPSTYFNIPRWFLEGGATWSQVAATYSADYWTYLDQQRAIASELAAKPDTYTTKWITDFLNPNPLTPWSYWSTYENWRLYDVGSLATEVLVALSGPDAYMRMYTDVGLGLTFAGAFEKEFGLAWADAVPIIASAIQAELKILR
jgi:hypothetical protein